MKLLTRIILIVLAVILIIVAIIGMMGLTFEIGYSEPVPGEVYAQEFGVSLLWGVVLTGIALIISTTRIRKFCTIPIAIIAAALIYRNPWAFDTRWGAYYPDNPWDNMAFVSVVIGGVVACGLSIYYAFFAKRKDSSAFRANK